MLVVVPCCEDVFNVYQGNLDGMRMTTFYRRLSCTRSVEVCAPLDLQPKSSGYAHDFLFIVHSVRHQVYPVREAKPRQGTR